MITGVGVFHIRTIKLIRDGFNAINKKSKRNVQKKYIERKKWGKIILPLIISNIDMKD